MKNNELELSYEEREEYSCKVCSSIPDADGWIEHGKGCYTQDEGGGGVSFVEMVKEDGGSEKAKD